MIDKEQENSAAVLSLSAGEVRSLHSGVFDPSQGGYTRASTTTPVAPSPLLLSTTPPVTSPSPISLLSSAIAEEESNSAAADDAVSSYTHFSRRVAHRTPSSPLVGGGGGSSSSGFSRSHTRNFSEPMEMMAAGSATFGMETASKPPSSPSSVRRASLARAVEINNRRRRSSIGESAPLFGSFIGSYEESILNGRMSTTPSKPVEFIAQIGVLDAARQTKMNILPPHLLIPFNAVFYSVQDYDSPSPYVGNVDITAHIRRKYELQTVRKTANARV